MKLFDTASMTRRELEYKDRVSMYVCGITPYDAAHIGHAFTFLTYDLLTRRLEDLGAHVRVVRNITDVDEPIYVKARELDMDYLDLAEQETTAFQNMMRFINLKDPDVEPKPSEHIDQIVAAVKKLVDRGYTYEIEGDIYFDVSKFPDFGRFSRYSRQLMNSFSASRGGGPRRAGKRDKLDFLLWRSVTDMKDPAAWDTVVGYGRPGWHIECTAMSHNHLGTQIDIHGGGTDLIFPHHECENAQSVALGHKAVVHWAHTAPILLGGDKMSKSLGNLVFVGDLVARVDPAAIRIALMSYHYRTGGEWRDDVLQDAVRLVDTLRHALRKPDGADPRPYLARVRAALDNDLDAPEAIRAVRELTGSLLVGGANTDAADGLRDVLTLLGIRMSERNVPGGA